MKYSAWSCGLKAELYFIQYALIWGGKLTEMSLQKSSREGWRGAWYPDFRQFGVNKLKD